MSRTPKRCHEGSLDRRRQHAKHTRISLDRKQPEIRPEIGRGWSSPLEWNSSDSNRSWSDSTSSSHNSTPSSGVEEDEEEEEESESEELESEVAYYNNNNRGRHAFKKTKHTHRTHSKDRHHNKSSHNSTQWKPQPRCVLFPILLNNIVLSLIF